MVEIIKEARSMRNTIKDTHAFRGILLVGSVQDDAIFREDELFISAALKPVTRS